MRVIVLTALALVASLTRETAGLLIVLAVFADDPRRPRRWLPPALALALVSIGLRFWLPIPPSPFTIGYIFRANLEQWRLSGLLQYGGLLLPLLGLCALGVYRAESRWRRQMVIILVPYLALVAVLGVWQEVRLLMPIFILSIPAMRPYTNVEESRS